MDFHRKRLVVLQRQRLVMLPPLINDVIIALNYLIAFPLNIALLLKKSIFMNKVRIK